MAAFAAAGDLIARAIRDRVTPAATIEVGTTRGVQWRAAFGALTYDAGAPPCADDTIFDLASLTKVIATTSIAMRLVDRGVLSIDTPIESLEPRWRALITPGGDRPTLRCLLDHSSGLPAHVALYKTAQTREAFLDQILALDLARTPGVAAEYSDVGFMLLGFLLERAAGATLDAEFAPIAAQLGEIGYRPSRHLRPRIAPTERDAWRGRLIQGEVHDENAFALGGVAAHAGLFGTVASVGAFARVVLSTYRADTWLARQATLKTFVAKSQVAGSSRALGWDTMLPTSSCGTLMSPRAIGHTGFTGTSLWIDPETDVYVALLTNRVHPTRDGSGIQELRRGVADAVVRALAG
ncbi:MAG: class A beta-lactamase-related serine hydrolase [Acidobacteria bacterium]|nr:MAG: class A beta-lactamase-related serine hydrolase [Acidobacteriota bacterium]